MASKLFTILLACFLLSVSTASAKLRCSVPNCTKYGAQARCYYFSPYPTPTTCQSWATTPEAGKQCHISCTGSCSFAPIYGSDGATYCRLCDLYIRACRTRFRVTGPVAPIPVVTPVDPPFKPTARQTFPVLQCSMQVCTFFGAEHRCNFIQAEQPDQEEITCAAYAATSQSQDQCQLVCTQSCDASGPYDNERTQYCSLCHLQQASCARDYEIYGPYLVPGIEECSEEYCSTHGDDARCLPSRFHTFPITCAEWKNSN